jgi:hypothetical protein
MVGTDGDPHHSLLEPVVKANILDNVTVLGPILVYPAMPSMVRSSSA